MLKGVFASPVDSPDAAWVSVFIFLRGRSKNRQGSKGGPTLTPLLLALPPIKVVFFPSFSQLSYNFPLCSLG